LNTPAKIDARWAAAANGAIAGFTATVTPNAEQSLPYYALHDYVLDWTLLDEKGKALSGGSRRYNDLIRTEEVAGSLPPDAVGHAVHLVVRLLGPTGVAAERSLDWPAPLPVK
jgi:hypothetical protein